MPLPRHIRLRRHKRLHLPVRRNGVFEFMLHEARLKPSIEKVVINRAALGKGSIRAVNQFINQYLVQLRFWNPDAAIEVIGTTSKDSKGEENPIVVEKSAVSDLFVSSEVVAMASSRSARPLCAACICPQRLQPLALCLRLLRSGWNSGSIGLGKCDECRRHI